MTHKTKNSTKNQPLRRIAYISKALTSHKGLSDQAFRIACVMIAHKESCEPTIAEAAILARVGRTGRRKSKRALIETGVCARDGTISYAYRKVREQYSRINPATITRDDLTDADLRVFVALSGFADRAGFAFPKYSTLSTLSTLKERTVRRAMSNLRRLGLVSEQRRAKGSSWKFVNDPLLFSELDGPDLPSETSQVMSRALKLVGREPAARIGGLDGCKLKYAHQTLVVRNMLFLDLRSKTERKNQESAPPVRPFRASDSERRSDPCQSRAAHSPASVGGRSSPNGSAPLMRREEAASQSAVYQASPNLATVLGGHCAVALESRAAHQHFIQMRAAPEAFYPRAEKTEAKKEERLRAPSPSSAAPLPRLLDKISRLGRASNRMQRMVLQQTLRAHATSWDCVTLRAIAAGALAPRDADSAREGWALHAQQKSGWTETYSRPIRGGKNQSMKNRGHGLFNTGKLGGRGSPDSIQPKPEFMLDDQTDVMCLLNAELRRRFGESVTEKLPVKLTGRQRGQVKKSIQTCYSDEQIVKMVRVLVWDWEEVRSGFWPKQRLPMPNMNSLVTYADTLIQYVDTGIPTTDPARRGRGGYAERYLTPGDSSGLNGEAPAAPRGFSLDSL